MLHELFFFTGLLVWSVLFRAGALMAIAYVTNKLPRGIDKSSDNEV